MCLSCTVRSKSRSRSVNPILAWPWNLGLGVVQGHWKWRRLINDFILVCHHSVARLCLQCCKSDRPMRSQWRKAIFGHLAPGVRNPWTDFLEIWQNDYARQATPRVNMVAVQEGAWHGGIGEVVESHALLIVGRKPILFLLFWTLSGISPANRSQFGPKLVYTHRSRADNVHEI